MSVGLIFFLSIIALIGIIAGSFWYMAAMMNFIFIKKHVEIDEVLSSGQPPEAWQKKYRKKLKRLKDKGASSNSITRLIKRQQRHNFVRLAQLIKYVRKTNLVEDEGARSNTLSQLDECKHHCQLEGEDKNGL